MLVEWFRVPCSGWGAALLGGGGIVILARIIWEHRAQ
jgi:hypothetical protein